MARYGKGGIPKDAKPNTSYPTGREHTHSSTGGRGVTFRGRSSSGKTYTSHASGKGASYLGSRQAAKNKASKGGK